MNVAARHIEAIATPPAPADVIARCEEAVLSADRILAEAKSGVRAKIAAAGGDIDKVQHSAHGLAWLATTVEGLRQMAGWARGLDGEGKFGEMERLLLAAAFGEYLSQVASGIPMNQGEMVRPEAMGIARSSVRAFEDDAAVAELIAYGSSDGVKARIATLIAEQPNVSTFGASGLDDLHAEMFETMRRFSLAEVVPHAHEWHLENEYIPLEIIQKLAELGVFCCSLPEEFGGMGLGKLAMCVVSEELSRGYIGVGSLGTRAEIAGELILHNGTPEQKAKFLPKIADGTCLPTAVFTEPNTGSDLASLKTRAVRDGDIYRVTGNKTWITHPVRADVMTMLVRTNPDEPGYKGLSILLGEKARGSDADPFPMAGLTGGEIEVLGYRGMKEYELAFDGFAVPAANLLGGVEGQGFKQLMQTFESARIQTAARAVGVAQSALDLGLRYAEERIQFGKPLVAFPRVSDKLAMIAVEVNIARQLTYFAGRAKDAEKRCDVEAGMAKLLGARIAWAAADNALQIHGGNGFALEYEISRVLCDARILNIFEGAAEIQAQVIARRLLDGAN